VSIETCGWRYERRLTYDRSRMMKGLLMDGSEVGLDRFVEGIEQL
jgi:hypothetical protein